MGFCSLQHLRNSRSTHRGPKHARYVPPSGFGYPLDGLLPRIPGRFCFTPAALMGFTLRRFHLPEGLRGLSAGRNPLTVGSAMFLPPKRQTGLTSAGFRVRALRKCLAADGVLSHRPLAPPMGFAPLGPATKTLAWTSPSLLSPASRVLAIARRIRWRLRVSIGPRLAPPDHAPKCETGRNNPYGVLHLPDPEHSGPPVPGLLNSPRVASHIAADHPTLLGHRRNPAEAVQDRP
jgi:hypothetical protein